MNTIELEITSSRNAQENYSLTLPAAAVVSDYLSGTMHKNINLSQYITF